MPGFISQPELVGAILKFISCHGVETITNREMNKVIQCATDIVNEFRQPERVVTENMGLDAWKASDNTGLSSLFMAGVLSGKFCRENNHPHDPADFNRCVGLLIACPEFRERLPKMAEHGKEWAAFVAHWEELELLLVEELPSGKAPKLYARIQEILN